MTLVSAAAAAAAQPTPPPPPLDSDAARQDLRCFVLYAIAVDEAQDEKVKAGTSLGLMYFFAKIKLEAPALNLAAAIRQEATAMDNDPRLKEEGAACDAEFQKRGDELLDLGQQLQELGPHSSSSS
jgi:hypothetical protein